MKRVTVPLVLWWMIAAVAPVRAAQWYVDQAAPNDSGNGSQAQPKKFIQSGLALLSVNGGDTLTIAPGTYSSSNDRVNGSGRSQTNQWNVVRAAADGTVRITAGLDMPIQTHRLQFEGLLFDSPTSKSVTGGQVKFLRCGFRAGPATGNTVKLTIGTNNATPGASHILLEDVYVYGPGGRYGVLVYNADSIVLRRVVVRHENGWTDTTGNPQANVSIYNSSQVLTQNLLLLDSRPTGYFEAALYHPSNTSSSNTSNNIQHQGAIIVNVRNNGVGYDGGRPSSNNQLSNSIIWNVDYVLSSNGSAHAGALSQLTTGLAPNGGINDWRSGGNFHTTGTLLWQFSGSNFSAVSHSGNVCFQSNCVGETSMNPATSGLQYLPRIESASALASAGTGGGRVGAEVLRRLGHSGSMYGEAGYDLETSDALWPWPMEADIKSAMCTQEGISTGFCAAPSLTRYIWEMLGNPIPAEIYDAASLFRNGFE